jgi:hypothetical protein
VTLLRRALRVAILPESWKEYFRERLEMVGAWRGGGKKRKEPSYGKRKPHL